MRPGPLAAACALVVVALASTVAVRSWSSGSAEEGLLVLERGASGPASSTSEPPLASPSTSNSAVAQVSEHSPAPPSAPWARASARAEVPADDTVEAERDPPARVEFLVVERSAASTLIPVPGVRFRYQLEDADERDERLLGETDRRGRLARSLPGPGWYRIRLDETSVPAGLTLSNLSATENGTERFYRAGTTTEQTFELVASRRLSGIVRDGLNGPVEGAWVNLLAVTIDPSNPQRGRSMNAVTTSPGGRFAWDALPQGEYVIHATQPEERSESPGRLDRPGGRLLTYPYRDTPEVYVDLRTASAVGVELEFDGDGKGVLLHGRVVNGEGEPIEGAAVTVVGTRVPGGPWNAGAPDAHLERDGARLPCRTEADGTFVLLEAPRSVLRVEVQQRKARRLRTAVLGAACLQPLTREVDLTAAPESGVDLGDLVVETLQPFEVRGRVELVGTSGPAALDELVFDARYPAGSVPRVDAEGQERPYANFNTETGAFVVRCNTPRDAVEVALFWRSSPQEGAIVTFVPVANETREGVVLRAP